MASLRLKVQMLSCERQNFLLIFISGNMLLDRSLCHRLLRSRRPSLLMTAYALAQFLTNLSIGSYHINILGLKPKLAKLWSIEDNFIILVVVMEWSVDLVLTQGGSVSHYTAGNLTFQPPADAVFDVGFITQSQTCHIFVLNPPI